MFSDSLGLRTRRDSQLPYVLMRRRPSKRAHARTTRSTPWPAGRPKPTRVLTTPERMAYEHHRRALPQHMVLAQVPLARFLACPRAIPMPMDARVGSLSADLVVCDVASRVLAVVEHPPAAATVRVRSQRIERMPRVLSAAARQRAHVWSEEIAAQRAEAARADAPRCCRTTRRAAMKPRWLRARCR